MHGETVKYAYVTLENVYICL